MDQTLTVPTLQRALTRYPAPDIHERLIRTIKEEKVDLSDYIKVPNLRGSVHSDRPDLIVGRFCVGWDAETLGFGGLRAETNRTVTLAIEYDQLKETDHIDGFRLDWEAAPSTRRHRFWDSDVAKGLEVIACNLATHPDDEMEKLDVASITEREYAKIDREWRPGDQVELTLEGKLSWVFREERATGH